MSGGSRHQHHDGAAKFIIKDCFRASYMRIKIEFYQIKIINFEILEIIGLIKVGEISERRTLLRP